MPELSPVMTGILCKVASTLCFAVMVILVKVVSAEVPVGELVFARSLFGLIPIVGLMVWQRQFPGALRTRRPLGHVARSVFGAVSMMLWFAAVTLMPLPDATAISYAAPIFITVLAVLVLREKVRPVRWVATATGCVGVGIILSEHLGVDPAGGRGLGALLALVSALFSALAMISLRRIAVLEPPATVTFYFMLTATALALVTLPFGWVTVDAQTACLMVLLGIFGGVGQVLMTLSYQRVEASVIAPLDYLNLLWVTLLGFLLLRETVSPTVLIGAGLVVAGGVLLVWRERRHKAR